MGTPTQVYVDPAIAADSGTGTIGDPYGDLQYALNTQVRDATNGDQFNVKAGTSEILAAALTLATYGTPTVSAPLIIRGYTAAANDGGQGVVSGNGSLACFTGTPVQTKLIDMRWTNCGAATILTLGAGALILHCEIDTTTGGGININGWILNSYLHNIGAIGITGTPAIAMFNTLRNETNDFTQAIQLGNNNFVMFNVIDIDGASNGINFNGDSGLAMFNSVFSNGGTGTGIRNATSSHEMLMILNNTIQGFSGVGGVGLSVVSQNADVVGHNLAFNNTTNYSITGDINAALGNNDTAGSSPFVNAGSDDFDPIAGLLALYPSYPTTWNNYTSTQQNLIRMAAQYAAASAGGALVLGGTVVR